MIWTPRPPPATGWQTFGWAPNIRAAWHFTESLRMDNLANRSYVGSVIVNETNSRYFEPAPGRTVYLMLSVSHR
jgi:outer membrane receptor protein involved in Fe transport